MCLQRKVYLCIYAFIFISHLIFIFFAVCFQVGLNSIALFGPRSYMVASYVNSMCNALKIPHIEVRMDHFLSDVPTFSINLHPDMHQLSRAYLDVIQYFQWKQVLVIFGDKEGKNITIS